MSGLEEFDRELFELEERINRLAIACDVDINDNNVIVSLIKGNYSVCPYGEKETCKELRALLMLKYEIEEHCIESLGTDRCLEIIHEVHEKMRHRGFTVDN